MLITSYAICEADVTDMYDASRARVFFFVFFGEITSKKKDLGLMLLLFCVRVTDWMMCACSDWMSCRRSLLAIAPGCIYKGEEVHVFPHSSGAV